MKIFKQLLHMVIIIAVAMTSLYTLANNLPVLVGSFRFLWGPVVLVSIFILQPTVFYKTQIKFLLLYGVISLLLLQYTLWNHMRDWDRMSLLDEYYSLIVFSSIFYYYYIRSDFRGLANVGKFGFYFVVVTVVMTNIALLFDPMVVRQSIAVKKKLRLYSARSSYIAKMRSHHNAIEIGMVADISKYLDQVCCLVSPFSTPHFSRPVIEAHLHKKAVIGTNVRGMDEIIEHNINGLIVPSNDPVALACAINKISSDRVKAKSLGEAGFQKAVQTFIPDKNIKKLQEVYINLSKGRLG